MTTPKSLTRCIGLAATLSLTALAFAGAPSHAAAQKIGVFDKQHIVDVSKLGLTAKKRFEQLQAQREGDVAEKQKNYETLQKSYSQKAAVLSEEKKLEMQRELARARDEWQSSMQNADRDLQRAYQSALLEIVSKIDPVIVEYGKAKSYDFLFDIQQVAFFKEAHDCTADIIRTLDSKHPR